MIAAILMKVFTGLVSMSSAGVLTTITDFLKGRTDAAAQVTLATLTAELESRKIARDIRLATAGFWEMRLITFVIAACFTLHLVLVTFDTITTNTRFEIVGWNVPALPVPFSEWQGAILLSFFGIYMASRVGTSILAGMAKKWGA